MTTNARVARAVMTACAILLLVGGFALACVPMPAAASQYRIIPDASHRLVRLGYDFRGEELVLFGAIAPPLTDHETADLVVAIEGPRRPAVLWHKRRFAGLWVDEPLARLADSPAFYALLASRPLSEIAAASVLARFHLPPEQLPLHRLDESGDVRPADPSLVAAAVEALAARGLIDTRFGPDVVTLREGALWRANIRLPASLAEGRFLARIFLFRNGVVIAQAQITFAARKTGIERLVARAAHRAPLLYGLAAVLLSLLAGWLASQLGRRRSF